MVEQHIPQSASAGLIIRQADGSVQPEAHDQHYGSYVINHPLPIEVIVGDSGGTPV